MRYVVSIYSLFMYLITWPVLPGIYVPCERLQWKPCGTEVGIAPWCLAPVHCVGNIAPFVTIRSLASKFTNGYIASRLDEYEQLSYLKDRPFFSFKPHSADGCSGIFNSDSKPWKYYSGPLSPTISFAKLTEGRLIFLHWNMKCPGKMWNCC